MADDILGGVLGDDEQPETEAPQALAGAEAFAAAIAAIASRQDPGVARKTEAFLGEQTRLLETQRRHLEDEHASRLTQLRLTVAAAKRKRYADYMRNALYTCIALLVVGVLLAAVRMTAEAMSDHGLVVEDFTVPADLATRGVTSQALAEDLASRVAAIRAFTNSHSLTYSSDVRADQAGTLKVQIPETGISVDELERFLHRWLGHETVVDGELREDAGGQVSVVLHIAGADPIVVSGSSTDLDRLMQAAAEKAFAVFDPINDIIYLVYTAGFPEAYDAAVHYVNGARPALSPRDWANGYTLVAGTDPDVRRGLSEAMIPIHTDPSLLVAWMTAEQGSAGFGHDEAAVQFARKWIATRRQDQPQSEQEAYPRLIAQGHIVIDRAMGDFAALRRDYQAIDRRTDQFAQRYADGAEVAALLHDEAVAQQDLALALAAGPADSAVLQARWEVSSSTGDWAQALDAANALIAAEEAQKSAALKSNPQRPEFTARYDLTVATQYRPLIAYAEAMTGDTASATALISQAPTDCYLCVRTRAKIAATAGDAATTDHWFAEAVREAPDLPMAYYEWGEALLARGDLAGAIAKLQAANQRGPHWADPLKAWGDVLAKQGHWKEALAKYDEALKYAPNWAALMQARGTAVVKTKD